MTIFTRYASTAAIAAGLVLTVAGAEISGAQAEEAAAADAASAASEPGDLAGETMPVFVSSAVVQPIPEPVEPAPTPVTTTIAQSLHQLVAAAPAAGTLSSEMECLAGAIYFEARGEPLKGQLAVAEVIINRSQSGQFPASYCGVVRQPGQFSFVRRGAIPAANRGTQAWRNAVAVAHIAHEERWQTEAENALYFHARYVRPSWSHRKQALATIDSHIFYR